MPRDRAIFEADLTALDADKLLEFEEMQNMMLASHNGRAALLETGPTGAGELFSKYCHRARHVRRSRVPTGVMILRSRSWLQDWRFRAILAVTAAAMECVKLCGGVHFMVDGAVRFE
ncbi:hypothetical protein ACFL6C_02430 [Myxococcota bacterium]